PQPVKPDQQPGPTPILKPLVSHSHVEAMSVTGGYVYRGKRLPDLRGQWIYGDYVTGKIWSFRHDGKAMSNHRELLDSHLRVICFGRDHAGEVYVVDYGGQIYRFEKNEESKGNELFPRKLSETGLFSDIRKQEPAPGVVPYEIQVEQWMDGAEARRFVAIPGNGRISFHKRNNVARGMIKDSFAFPADTVIAKTISVPEPARHIETQILHFNGEDWQPYNYIWNVEQTEAHLSDGKGADVEISGLNHPWRSHSNTECMTCHMARPGYVLGLHQQFSDIGSQHQQWVESGLLEKKPKQLGWLQQEDEVQRQARAWLHVNCAHCHRRGGGGTAPFELRADQQLERNRLFVTTPNQGHFGMKDPKIIVPGEAGRSVLLYRLASTGGAHMPKLGSRTVDRRGLHLVRDWINELAEEAVIPEWRESPDLFQDTAKSMAYLMSGVVSEKAIVHGLSGMPPHIYDLFESFVPEASKRKILGPLITDGQMATILALSGDSANGAKLFRQVERTQCINCHKLGDEGREVGPALSGIGDRYSRAQLLESLVKPSRYIDPRFQAVSIDLKSGESFTGYVVSRKGGSTVLRDLTGKSHSFKSYQIESSTRGQLSLMPEGLLQSFTPQEAADLVAYLASLN
ncbi:MAG: c-type cytochrome, partial [Limisphaerales bacterium]